ncbi:disks large 1 tumor suppressor protein-like isoform X3 [Toxorhynchites rutilus septentrionalis]|uniref:disks large 1 tumor suppressor protein-like isoform X3 n=1 Tax=Toxorhynchites rutilus septentrionalis TaxID=329112 RepID=UPI002479C3B9|nr:disks large 1 tumor suppressor protein-like isoform X3 [Toxorhynchites rutilus septentrionalis]
MPVKKQEAHRALELLEDYHSRLSNPQDKALRSAIERVIRIFKSRLFQALLDIQEFYELTLLDDSKSVQQKTAETLLIASKWEQDNAAKANEANRVKQQEQQQHQQQQQYQQEHSKQPTEEEEKAAGVILAETPSPSHFTGTRVTIV